MPGKRPRSFLRTSSRPQLLQSYGDESLSPLPRAAVKCAMGTPQRVVVGFDVSGGNAAENSSKAHADACESPRSVLEPDALGDDHHHHPRPPSTSPRSVLDRLLSRPETPSPGSNEGICVRNLADIRPEKPAVRETGLTIPEGGNPNIAIPEQICVVDYPQKGAVKEELTSMLPSCHDNAPEDVVFGGDDEDDDNVSSIFYAASPFSCCGSLDASAGDFLSGCFFCKSRLMPGKDIYMYRGDRAFCSAECRYQQIIVDERKERHSAASNCYAKHFPHMHAVPSGLS